MLKLFNSLTKQLEDFRAVRGKKVRMYACGPTVYQFAHIGNFRSYMTSDILVRALQYNGYAVNFVMNITDVGHMTQDQLGGGDTGEDKVEKTARKEGKTVWEVAEFYTEAFLKDYEALGLTQPTTLCKATDHIQEQIDLIQKLQEKRFTYTLSDGVYFDTSRFADYGKMSSLDVSNDGVARVATNEEKKNPRDFALWKFSPEGEGKRSMEWDSPWGKGFPGWHIECSAMSMKYLGETFDIHTGGVDHKEIHHPNEIAQSEAVTGKKLANYWVHTAFMLVAGQKMSKSLENAYTLYDLAKEGYDDPLVLRYLYMNGHYRQEMNFTFAAMDAAQNALKKLRHDVAKLDESITVNSLGDNQDDAYDGPTIGSAEYEQRFLEALNDDLNMPQALAVMWELIKSDHPAQAKVASLYKMDRVLGLDLQGAATRINEKEGIVPGNVQQLVEERNALRRQKRFNAADHIRAEIKKLGYDIEDTKKGVRVKRIQ